MRGKRKFYFEFFGFTENHALEKEWDISWFNEIFFDSTIVVNINQKDICFGKLIYIYLT